MTRIILSTESGADLPKDLVKKYQIQVVPMHIIMDGKDYLDGELSVEEVFDYHSNIDRKQLYLIYSIGLDESIKSQMDELAKEKGFENIIWMQAGAMISTYAGPGGFGIAGLEY